MPTFGPYVLANQIPGVAADTRGLARRMFRMKGGEPQGKNVWILTDGTAVDSSPQATYNADGSMALSGADRTVRFMQGAVAHTVTTAEAAILTSSGFGEYVT